MRFDLFSSICDQSFKRPLIIDTYGRVDAGSFVQTNPVMPIHSQSFCEFTSGLGGCVGEAGGLAGEEWSGEWAN